MEAVKPKVLKKRRTKIKREDEPSRSDVETTTSKSTDDAVVAAKHTELVVETAKCPEPVGNAEPSEVVVETTDPSKLVVETSKVTDRALETASNVDEDPQSDIIQEHSLGKKEDETSENGVSEDSPPKQMDSQIKSSALIQEQTSVVGEQVVEFSQSTEQPVQSESEKTLVISNENPTCDNVVQETSHVNILSSEEVPIASCPEAVEISELEVLMQPLYPVQDLAHALDSQQKEIESCIVAQPKAKISEQRSIELIKPFTEEQLLALYRNEELEMNEAFIDYFVQHEKEPQNSELYELLQGYLRSRLKLVACRKERDENLNDVTGFGRKVWTLQTQTATGMSPCADGANITKSHTYVQASMNQGTLNSVTQLLQQLREQVQESLALHTYGAEVAKLQIEAYIYMLLVESSLVQVPCNAPVTVIQGHELTRQHADENQRLRECIGDLFSFQRRPVSDKQFVDDTRRWLTDLVALLLRRATIADHLFVLNHVLRCPAGINEWATCFVQPLPPIPWSADPSQKHFLSSSLLDHSLSVLATLLMPVKARDVFLQPFEMVLRTANPGSYKKKTEENLWVLVDSEGEEDEDLGTMWLQWQEGDVISLINQVPLADLFRHALFIHPKEDADDYDVRRTEEHGMLRLLALGSRLLQLLGQGFRTYNSLRYKQLTKRISRLIRHTVQYISDHWEAFCSCSTADPALLKRMQVEFDNFFLRAINCIFSSQRMGAWQFMAVLPYKNVSLSMMWHVLWTLHHISKLEDSPIQLEVNYQEKLKDPMVCLLFEEKLSQLPESEAFYLLTAFANMAKSRRSSDSGFIAAVCLEVMEIAFLNVRLRDNLSKEGRDLLSAIASKHTFIISLLLKHTADHIDKLGMMSLYLFRSLPLSIWKPKKSDLDIISIFLLENPLTSAANQLAKLIITSMNWDCTIEGDELFLSVDVHYEIAMLVVQACEKHARLDSDSGILMWSVQQALLVAQSLRQSATQATTPQGFLTWAWDTLLSLHLHVLDRPSIPWTSVLSGDVSSHDPSVPHLEGDPRLHHLLMGVKSGRPPALYVAVLMTTIGHSVKRLNERGLALWSTLVTKEMYSAATHILSFTLPFYYPDPSQLLNNQGFLSDLLLVVMADLTYKHVAKSLIYTVFPGKALQHFAGMLRFQIRQARTYAAEVGGQAVRFWCQVLFHMLSSSNQKSLLTKWKGTDHVHYLLDQLFKIAIQDAYLLDTLMETMARMVKDQSPVAASGGVAASFLNLVSWSTGSGHVWPSLLSFPSLPNFPCLFWAVLMVETIHPQMNKLWESLLTELETNNQMSPEVALKTVCGNVHLPVPLLSSLPIYRWAQQALEMDLQHPCLPLLWQNFFTLYLYRSSSSKWSMGFRFFAENPHLGLLKKMKRRLGEISEHFKKMASQSAEELEIKKMKTVEDERTEDDILKEIQKIEFHQKWQLKLMRFYRSLSLWIEEPRLHETSLNLQSLPQQYDAERLHLVIHSRQKFWLDLVDMDSLKKDLDALDNLWLQQRKAQPVVSPRFNIQEELPASDRIVNRLKTYEDPLPAPKVPRLQLLVTQVTPQLLNDKTLLADSVKESSRRLVSKASSFSTHISKHLALDSEYVELLPNLYRNVEAQTLVRGMCSSSSGCEGPATFYLKYKEARMLNGVKADIDQNRLAYEELLQHFDQPPEPETCASAVFVKNCISALVKQNCNRTLGETHLRMTKEVGVTLFYHLLGLVNDTTNQYPPTRQFISSCLDVLGQEFVHGHEDQCLPLVKQVLSRPNLAGLVAPLFTPAQVSCSSFLQLYEVLGAKLCPNLSSALFVLLTKFDVGTWLRNSKPTILEREQLLASITSALTTIGQEPSGDMLVVLDVFRNHLQHLYQYQFPELLGQTMLTLLKGSAEGWLSVCVWEDFLSSIAGGCHRPQNKSKEVVGQWLITFASTQPHIQKTEAENCLDLLSKFLLNHRHSAPKNSKGGLYQSLSLYFDPIVHLTSMVAHAYISLSYSQGALLWEVISCAFSPWLEPLIGDQTRLPFAPENVEQARWVFDLFTLTVGHLHSVCSQVSPSNDRTVLSSVWQWYEKLFAQPHIMKHLRSTTHEALQLLPWSEFIPNYEDLNLMKKILESGLTDCHDFLGHIFLNVPWPSLSLLLQKHSKEVISTSLNIVASLFVQLSWQAYVLQTGLLQAVASSLASVGMWSFLDSMDVQRLVLAACTLSDPNKFIQRAFPEVLVFRILYCFAGFGSQETFDIEKRKAYINGAISLVAKASPPLVQSKKTEFSDALVSILDLCLGPAQTNSCPTFQEISVLLTEYVWLLKPQTCSSEIRELAFTTLMSQLQSGGPIVLPLVAVVCRSQLAKPTHLVRLTELALEVACNKSVVLDDGYSGWRQVVPLLVLEKSVWEDFFKACIESSAHLSQNAFFLHVLPQCQAASQELDLLQKAVDWCSNVKASDDTEPKLLLLWDKVLELSIRQFDLAADVKATQRFLQTFCASLQAMGEDKLSSGLLGAVGLGKRSPFSLELRLMCRSVSAFVLCQMPTNGEVRLAPNTPGHVRSQEGSRGKPSQQALQALAKVESMRNSKLYSSLVQQADYAWNFILDARYSLRDSRSLIREFSAMFYSKKAFLKILCMDGSN